MIGDGSFLDVLRRGMKNFRETVKEIADPIIELRQMVNRVAQPEASTGMFNGGIVIPYGPISMPLRPQFYYGPNNRPDAPSFSKGGVVKGSRNESRPFGKGKKAKKAKAKKPKK